MTNAGFSSLWSGGLPTGNGNDINITNVFMQDTTITNLYSANNGSLNYLRIISGSGKASTGTSNLTVIVTTNIWSRYGLQLGQKATLIIGQDGTFGNNENQSFDLTGGRLVLSNGAKIFLNFNAASQNDGTIQFVATGTQQSDLNYAQNGGRFLNNSVVIKDGSGTGAFVGNFGGNNFNFINAGSITVNGGTFVINTATATTSGGFSNSSAGIVTINSGATFIIARASGNGAGWDASAGNGDARTEGTIFLNGGSIQAFNNGALDTTKTLQQGGNAQLIGSGTLAIAIYNNLSGGTQRIIASNGLLSVGTVYANGQGTWVSTNVGGTASTLEFRTTTDLSSATLLNSNGTIRIASGASITNSTTFLRNDGSLALAGGTFTYGLSAAQTMFTNSLTGVISGNGTFTTAPAGNNNGARFVNLGTIIASVNGGTLTINTGGANTFSNAAGAFVIVNAGAFFTIANNGWGLDSFNLGTYILNGGSITENNNGTPGTDRPIRNEGTIVGNGTLTLAVFNQTGSSGKIIASNGVLSIGTIYNSGAGTWVATNYSGAAASVLEFRDANTDLSSGTLLNSNGTVRIVSGARLTNSSTFVRNDGTIELAGGTLTYSAATALTNSATGVIYGNGTIGANVSLVRNLGLIAPTNGVLNFTANLSNAASGFIRIDGGGATAGTLSNAVAWANLGVITNLGGRLVGGNVTNLGTVVGFGTNTASFVNLSGGSVVVTNGTMGFTGSIFSNASGGTIRVSDSATLSGNVLTNLGTIFTATGNGTGYIDAAVFNASGGAIQVTNATLRMSGDLVNGGLINIGTATTSGTLSNNNLFLVGSGQITFTNASGILANTLIVAGTFTNTTSSVLNMSGASAGGSVLIKFLDSTKIVTNSGTMSFQIVGANNASVTVQVGSDATAGTFVNSGTVLAILGGSSLGRNFTFSNLLVNAGTLVITNTSSSPSGTLSFTATKDVTNQLSSTVKMFLSGGGNSTLTLSTGNYINLGTNVFTSTAGTGGNAINLITSGAVFSNAASGVILLTTDNIGTNRLLVGAANAGNGNVVNAGTISIGGGTLLIQTTGGGVRGLRNVGTITMLGGNLQADSGITNFNFITGWGTLIGSVVNTNGTILADARTIANRDAATLTVSLSTFTNNNGATIGAIGTNSTLLVAIANSALINNGTIQLSAGNIVLSNTLTGTTGGSITNFNTIAGVGDVSSFPIVQSGNAASLIAKDPTDGSNNLVSTVGSINSAVLGAVSNANGIATLQLTLSGGATVLSNAGTIAMQGGALTVNGTAGTITNTGVIYGFGGLSNNVANRTGGTILASNGTFRVGLLNNFNAGVLTNFDSSSTLRLTNTILVNTGKIFLSGGGLIMNGSIITNQGTITGPGQYSSGLYNDTNGTVMATGGTLAIATNGPATEEVVNAGTITIANASTLQVGGTSLPVDWNNITVSGSGTGQIVLAGTATIIGGILTNAGTISGNGSINNNGLINAAGGTITIAGGNTLNVVRGWTNLAGTVVITSGTLTNGSLRNSGTILVSTGGGSISVQTFQNASAGTMVVSNGVSFILNSAAFNNAGTILLDATGGATIQTNSFNYGQTGAVMTNAGTIVKTSTGFSEIIGNFGAANLAFLNTGTITVNAGTLSLNTVDAFSLNGVSNAPSGWIQINGGATFLINRSANAWNNDGISQNEGMINLNGGTLTVQFAGSQASDRPIINDGTIMGAGTLALQVQQSGSGRTIASNGVLNIFQTVAGNQQTFTSVGGQFGVMRAVAGGDLKINGNIASGNAASWAVDAGGTVEVAGVSADLNTAFMPGSQLNGTVKVNTGGNLTLSGATGISGQTLQQNGTFDFAGGQIFMPNLSGLAAFTNAGYFVLSTANNGTFTSGFGAGQQNYGIVNTGTILVNNAATLTLAPRDAATAGGFSNTSLGTVIISNGGVLRIRRTATQWDAGNTANAGTIILNGGSLVAVDDSNAIRTQAVIRNIGTIFAQGTGTATNTWNASLDNAGTIYITNNTAILNLLAMPVAGNGITNTTTGQIFLGGVGGSVGTLVATNLGANGNSLFNRGLIQGQGTLTLGQTNGSGGANANFVNSGNLVATNWGSAGAGNLFISVGNAFSNGGFSNTSVGTISISSNTTLTVNRTQNAWANSGNSVANLGTINLTGGSLNLASDGILSNAASFINSGTISGWGTIDSVVITTNGGKVFANATNLVTEVGTLTLRVASTTNNSSSTLGTIGTNSVLNLIAPGGQNVLINFGTVSLSGGTINFAGGAGTITNFFVVAGVGNLSSFGVVNTGAQASVIAQAPIPGLSNLIATVGVTNSAILGANNQFGAAATLTLGTSTGGGLVNNGTLAIQGGFITVTNSAGADAGVTNLAGQIYGFGTQTFAVANLSGGSIVASNGILSLGLRSNLNQGLLSNFNSSATLRLTNSILVNASTGRIALNGGGFIMAGSIVTNQGAITGPGNLADSLFNDTGGFVAATNGTLNLATNGATEKVENLGIFDIASASTLNVSPAWNNTNGTVRLNTGTLSGGAVTNKGTIVGTGTITSSIINAVEGTVKATNGDLNVLASAVVQNGTLIGGSIGGPTLIMTNLTASLRNNGTMLLDSPAGGPTNVAFYLLRATSGSVAPFTNAAGALIQGAGYLSTGDGIIGGRNFAQVNQGTIIATNGALILNPADAFNLGGFVNDTGGAVTVAVNSTFGIQRTDNAWSGAATNSSNRGTIILQGGTFALYSNNTLLARNRVFSNTVTGVIAGAGTIEASLANLGTLAATNGLLRFNGPTLTQNGTLIGGSSSSATLQITNLTGNLVNNGTMVLASALGGTTNLAFYIFQDFTNATAGMIQGAGILRTGDGVQGGGGQNYSIYNSGSILATNGALIVDTGDAFGSSFINAAGATVTVANASTFGISRTTNAWVNTQAPVNNSVIQLAGGVVQTFTNTGLGVAATPVADSTRSLSNSVNATITGNGTLGLTLVNLGTVVATNGILTVSSPSGRITQRGTLDIEMGGTLLLTNAATTSGITFSNSGTILMRGGSLLAGTITNATTIQGYGTIEGGGVANGGTLLANATNLTTAGTLTVRLSSFTNVAAATLGVIGTNTVLDVLTPGNAPYLVNLGTINLSAGRITNSLASGFTITNFFVIAGVGDLSSLPVVNTGATASIIAQNPTQGISNFLASVSVTNSAILGANNFGGAATLSLTVGDGSQGLVNNGTIALVGGFIKFNGGASEVTNRVGQIYGSGSQSNLNVANLSGGSVVASNGTLRFGALNNLNQGLLSNFNASSTLLLTNSILVNASTGRIALNGGGFVMAGSIITNQGTITGPGDLADSLFNDTSGFVAATNGTLNLATNGATEKVENLGTFDIASASTLNVSPAWNNTNGTVFLHAGTLSGSAVTNKGTIQGGGTITATLINAVEGVVKATNTDLNILSSSVIQNGTMIGGLPGGTTVIMTNLTRNLVNNGTLILGSPAGVTNVAFNILRTTGGSGDFTNGVTGVISGAGFFTTADFVPGSRNFSEHNFGTIVATNGALIMQPGDAFGNGGFVNYAGGTVSVATATSTFAIQRTDNAWNNSGTAPRNEGAIILNGGTFNLVGDSLAIQNTRSLSNALTGVISGFGTLNANVINVGTMIATNGTLVMNSPTSSGFTNTGTIALETGGTFTLLVGANQGLNTNFVNNGRILAFGGTLVSTNVDSLRNQGTISGFGTIQGGRLSGAGGANANIVNFGGGFIIATNGTLFVNPGDAFDSGGFSNSSAGTVIVANNATFALNRTANAWNNSVGAGFSNPRNRGTIELDGGSFLLFSDGVADNSRFIENIDGRITGFGTISASVTNFGTIGATNGLLVVDGTGKFRQAGTLSIDFGGTLRLTNSTALAGMSFTNEASILMRGGELQAGVIANTNVIFGFGTISGGGVDNSGRLLASNGMLTASLSSITNRSGATLGTLTTNSVLSLALPGGGTALTNEGTISMRGGILQFSGSPSGTIGNATNGTIIGVGDLSAMTVVNDGTIMAANPVSGLSIFSVGLSELNSATIGASNSATLNVLISGGAGSSFNNNGSITMLGGTLIISNGAPGVITNNSMITGSGTIVPAIVNLRTNAATVNGGTLDITLLGGTNSASGYLLAGQGAVLQVQNALINLGTIAANGANGGTVMVAQASGIITNRGTGFITSTSSGGSGLTFNSLVRNVDGGTIIATNGTLTFASINGLYNSNATIRIDTSGTLQSNSSNSWRNAGSIELRGGTLRTGGFTNAAFSAVWTNAGTITGYGTIIGGGAYGSNTLTVGFDKSIVNMGTILATNPLSAAAGTLYISTGNATTQNGIQNLGTIIIASTNTLVLNRAAGLPILNRGTISIQNGTLTGSGVLSNTGGGIIEGYGTLSHQIVNLAGGTIRATNGTLVLTSAIEPVNYGTLQIETNSVMQWNATNSWINNGTIDLRWGTLRTGGPTNALAGGEPFTNANFIVGSGTIIGGGAYGTNPPASGFDKAIINLGTIIATNRISGAGTLIIDTGVSTLSNGIANFGTMVIATNNTLVLRRAAESLVGHLNFIENTGTILINGGTLTANSALTNRANGLLPGLIQGFGEIAITNRLVNAGTIRSTNGVLAFVNPAGGDVLDIRQNGTLAVEKGSEMIFGAATNAPLVNSGTIVMRGGYLRSGAMTNLSGARFSGFGTITSPTIINAGTGMATSLSQVLHLTGDSLVNRTNGVLGARNGRLIVDGVFTNAGTVSFLNSVGTFNASVVNQGAWQMDPSTNVFYGNFTVATNGYITMTQGDVFRFKSNFYNSSTLSNQYSTLAGKFLFDGDDGLVGTYTQLFYVAGLNLGGANLLPLGSDVVTNAYLGSGNASIVGFTNNFALGTLQVGSLNSTSTLTLLDTYGALESSDGKVAGLYVNQLTINPGSLLIISNNVELYFKRTNGVTGVSIGTLNPGDNVLILDGGSFHQLGIVPEPSVLMLLVLGSVGIYWRRRRKRLDG